MIRWKCAREMSPVGSIPNGSTDRRFELASALCVLAALIVIVFSAGVEQASAVSGWDVKARSSTVPGDTGAWARTQKPGQSDPLLTNLQFQSVACSDVHTCFATGTRQTSSGPNGGLMILASHDGGASWSSVYQQPGPASSLLSCPGPLQCYVIGSSFSGPPQGTHVSLLRTTDGGTSWHRSNIETGHAAGVFLTGFTCPSTTVCFITAMALSPIQASSAAQAQALLIVTKNGGQSWTSRRISAVKNFGLRAIACTSASSCDVGGVTRETSCFQAGAILHTDDGGSTWHRQFRECATSINALACHTARTCYAGGSYGAPNAVENQLVLRTHNGGASWEDELVGPIGPADAPNNLGTGFIAGITCPDAQVCFLSAGNHIVATTDGGATSGVRISIGNAGMTAISCPTARVCVSVGTVQPSTSGPGPTQPTGLLLRTIDGGKTWTRL